jgi:hypothetical protein
MCCTVVKTTVPLKFLPVKINPKISKKSKVFEKMEIKSSIEWGFEIRLNSKSGLTGQTI